MSKKIAILSAIMLVFGGVSIPGGIVINGIIDTMVTDRVDDGLLGIQEQFIPIAEAMILELGPAIALQMIKEIAVPAGIPLVYASFLTQLLYNAYDIGEESSENRSILGIGYVYVSGGDCLLNMFFDEVVTDLYLFGGETSFSQQLKNKTIPYAPGEYILGISEWNQTDLNIGHMGSIAYIAPNPHPNDWLAWGQSTPKWHETNPQENIEVNDPPGFMQHTKLGFGVLDFLENFTKAKEDGSPEAINAFLDPYEAGEEVITMDQMQVVHDYFYKYWIPTAMPILLSELQNESSTFAQYAPEYINMTLDDIAYYEFLKQWTSYATYSNGADFHEFVEEFPIGTYGLEVDSPTIPVNSMYALWDELNEWSLLNITGIQKWLAANSNAQDKLDLETHFNLTAKQAEDILNWLWEGPNSFSQGLLPKLLESKLGYNMKLSEFAKVIMLEQWANGTIMDMNLFEGGIDFSDFITSLPEGSTGFEVGVPIPTGMSIESASLLWDTSNSYSLVKDISVWWNAGSKDSESYTKIRDANKLDDATMDMILAWLPEFKTNLMPALAQYEMGLPMDTTSLGNTIQIGGMVIGAIAIGLASTGIVSNRVLSKKRKSVVKGDKSGKTYDKFADNLGIVSRDMPENQEPGNRPTNTNTQLHNRENNDRFL